VSEPRDELQEWPFQDFAAELHAPGEELDQDPLAEPLPWHTSDEVDGPPPEAQPFDADVAEAPVAEAPAEAPPEVEEQEPEPEPEPAPAVIEQHAAPDFRPPDGYELLEGTPDGNRRTVGVVVARFNGEITTQLLERALATLEGAGVAPESIVVMPVPGAFELPLAAMALAKTRRYACILALGCVIRGETSHFDFVAGEAASGLQLAAIETGVPIAFGLLTCENREQALARIDRAADSARTALEMADLFARLRAIAR
jgi:6,7-dimethyl-8-ribityllumazine synthase